MVAGRVVQIIYAPHATTPYDGSYDIAVTTETTGVNIWTQATMNGASVNVISPRFPTYSQAGAVDAVPVVNHIPVAKERIKLAVTNAGDTKTGTYYIVLDGVIWPT